MGSGVGVGGSGAGPGPGGAGGAGSGAGEGGPGVGIEWVIVAAYPRSAPVIGAGATDRPSVPPFD